MHLLRRGGKDLGSRLELAGLLEQEIHPGRLPISHALYKVDQRVVCMLQMLVGPVDLVHKLMGQVMKLMGERLLVDHCLGILLRE
jgi:hypothetical protein